MSIFGTASSYRAFAGLWHCTESRLAVYFEISIDRAKSGARDASAMVKLVQFMDATERMIVEETVHVDG